MKVAFFLPRAANGGVVRATIPLVREFAHRGHHVQVLTFNVQTRMLDQIDESAEMIDLNATRAITALPRLVSYLRRERPNVLISAQHYANVVAIAAQQLTRVDTKVIVTEREAIEEALARIPLVKRALLARAVRIAYPKAYGAVGITAATAKHLARFLGWPDERVTPILNAMLIEDIRGSASQPLNHHWFDPDQPPVILGAGRFTDQKDFENLVRALAIVRQSRDCRLLILGEGPQQEQIRELAGELGVEGAVEMPGFALNPYKYMARASAFALSSRYEGLANVLIEAQACGVPVVSTDCPTGPREILMDGACGILVPVGDPDALAAGILKVLESPELADRLTTNAQASLHRFTPERAYADYMKLIGSAP